MFACLSEFGEPAWFLPDRMCSSDLLDAQNVLLGPFRNHLNKGLVGRCTVY